MTSLSATYITSFFTAYFAIDLWLAKDALKELCYSVSSKSFTFFTDLRQYHCGMSSVESGSDVEDIHALVINEHFTKALEYKNEHEELAKCLS